MLSKQRQDKILDILREKGKISFTDLAKKLNTSYATIRRDCENLESFNLVTRISKGVELNEYKYDIDISYRQVKNISKKRKIAKRAAKFLKRGSFIFLDSGTTVNELIPYLKNLDIRVVTNGIMHLPKLIDNKVETILVGGRVKPTTRAIVSPEAIKQIKRYRFDYCFMGANAINEELGYMTPDPDEAEIKRAVIESSKVAFVLAEKSKCDKISNVRFSEYDKCIYIWEDNDIHSNA